MHIRSQMVAGAVAAAAVGLTSLTVMSGPAHAAAPGRIAGAVTAAGTGPVAGIHAAALQWQSGSSDQWVEVDSALTGADGRYNIGKLPPGKYVVRFYDPSGKLATEFYQEAAGPEAARPIEVTSGKEELASAELGGAAHLTGTVTGSTGGGIGGAEVTAYVLQPSGWTALQSVVTGADGTYDLGGLRADTYTLGFHDPATGVGEYWNDESSLVDADEIHIRNIGTSNGLSAQLATPLPEQPTSDPTPTATPTATPTVTATPTTATTSAPAAPVTTSLKAMAVTKKPAIKGKAVVGSRLRVTPGTVNPTAVARKIQWFAGGKAIKKATKRRFKVTTKQVGKKITVKVTLAAPGYTTRVVTTRATRKVKR